MNNPVLKTFNHLRTGWQKFDAKLRLLHYQIANYSPRVEIQIERGHFLLKTAADGAELEQALRLRYEIFHREYRNKKGEVGVDIDRLDFISDHLLICDRRNGDRVIGTYRLNCSRFNQFFYSSSEFNIEKLLAVPGEKLELGRACIDREFRTGSVIHLLWRGIVEYFHQTECQLLFGCASVKTMDPLETAQVYHYLEKRGSMDKRFWTSPTDKYTMPGLDEAIEAVGANLPSIEEPQALARIEELIPPLFHTYLKLGTKVCGIPALDKSFGCVDFLIALKLDELHPLFARKYAVKAPPSN